MSSPTGARLQIDWSALNQVVEVCGDAAYYHRLYTELRLALYRHVVSANGRWLGLHFTNLNGEVHGGAVVNLETNETHPLPRRFVSLELTGIADDGLLLGLCQDYCDCTAKPFAFGPGMHEIQLLPPDSERPLPRTMVRLHHVFPNGDVLGTALMGSYSTCSEKVGESAGRTSEGLPIEFPDNPLFDALSKYPSSKHFGLSTVYCLWQRSVFAAVYRLRCVSPEILGESVIPYGARKLLLTKRTGKDVGINFQRFDETGTTSITQLDCSRFDLLSTHVDGSFFGQATIPLVDQIIPFLPELKANMLGRCRNQANSAILNVLWDQRSSRFLWIGCASLEFDFCVSNVSPNARYILGWKEVKDNGSCNPVLLEADEYGYRARRVGVDGWTVRQARVTDDGTLLCLAARSTHSPTMPIRVRVWQA